MKKLAALLAVLPLLAAVGCNAKEDVGSEPGYVLELDSLIISTEEETAEETAETDTAAESEADIESGTTAEPSVSSEETAEETMPVMTGMQQTEPAVEIMTETAAPLKVTELHGTWEYVDGYRIRFLDDGAAELLLDYSGVMHFQENELYYNSALHPVKIADENISVTVDGETVLKMIALERTSVSNMNGRYRLEDCALYTELNGSPRTDNSPVYYVEVDSDILRVVTKIQYQADETGSLRMIEDGSELLVHYTFQGDQLVIYDATGTGDVLTRVE